MNKLNKLLNDTLETYYWIGFVMADGWVTVNKFNQKYKNSTYERTIGTFGVILSSIDHDHLSKLSQYIEAPIRTGKRSTNYKKDARYSIVKVCNLDVVRVLKDKFMIENDKTTSPPNWSVFGYSDDQMLAMIIGYIDGDASIAKRKSSNVLHISFQSHIAWKDNLLFIKTFLENYFDTPTRSKVSINNRNHATLSICRSDLIVSIKEFATKNNLPILDRKWDVVHNYKNNSKNKTRNITFEHEDGSIENPVSVRRFAIDNNLSQTKVWKLTNGIIDEYKGWKIING